MPATTPLIPPLHQQVTLPPPPPFTHQPAYTYPHLTCYRRYPVLQWQLRAARRGLQAVAVSRPWLQERVALARYTGLPLAQLEGDAFLGAASALFARSLRDMGHVLWWRDSSLPGIGEDQQGLGGEWGMTGV